MVNLVTRFFSVYYKRDSELLLRQTTNGHVTMIILHLPLAVFSFSVKLSSFALTRKAKIGHFRVAVNPTMNARLSAKLFI